MIKSNDSIACAIFQNADLPVKNSISNFFCEMAGQIHGFFVRKISLLHGKKTRRLYQCKHPPLQ